MLDALSRWIALTVLLPSVMAAAEPIELKLSYFTSNRSEIYRNSIKPFVDAVNADSGGLLHIEVFFSGALDGDLGRMPQQVASGRADLALLIVGRTPDRFYDSAIVEMPGLFRSAHEADLVFSQLVSKGALAGYGDFHVIGAFVSGPEYVHSRKPISSLADLKGQTLRVNNPTEAEVLQRFGAIPVLLSINETAEAIAKGTIDGAASAPSMLQEFGIGRVATHHYMMALGGAPQALVMNRKRFESLPPQAQALLRKYSGDWVGIHSTKRFDVLDREAIEALKADGRRTVVFPSAADARKIDALNAEVLDQWSTASEHNRELLAMVRAQLGLLRPSE